jgi:hypothetical protein
MSCATDATGGSGTITGSGTVGTIPLFSGSTVNLASSIISQSGANLTVSGNLLAANGGGGMNVGTWPRNASFAYISNGALNNTSANGNYALLQESNGTTYINASAGSSGLRFRINNGDIMSINTTGGVVTTAFGGDTALIAQNSAPSSSSYGPARLATPNYSGEFDGDVYTGGCFLPGDFSNVIGSCRSDQRLKEAIVPFQPILDRFVMLRPVHYRWNSAGKALLAPSTKDSRRTLDEEQTGLVAQEVERVFPDLVRTDADGYKRVSYGNKLQMMTIQAIKEQQEQIEALKREVAELKALLRR